MSGQATDNLEENAREKPLIPLPFCFSNVYLNNSSLFQLSLRTLWTSPSTKLSLRTVIRLFEKRHKRLVGKYQEILYGTYCCLVYQKMKKYPRSWAIPRTSFHLSFCHLWRQNKCGCPEQRRNKLGLRQNTFVFHRINCKDSGSDPSYPILTLKALRRRRRGLAVPALQLWSTSSRTAELLLPVLCQQDKNTGLYLRQGLQWITPTLSWLLRAEKPEELGEKCAFGGC